MTGDITQQVATAQLSTTKLLRAPLLLQVAPSLWELL